MYAILRACRLSPSAKEYILCSSTPQYPGQLIVLALQKRKMVCELAQVKADNAFYSVGLAKKVEYISRMEGGQDLIW